MVLGFIWDFEASPGKRKGLAAEGRQTEETHAWAYALLHTNSNGRNGNFLTFFRLAKQPRHHARNWPFFFFFFVRKETEKSPQQNVVRFLYCGKKNKRFLEGSLSITATNQLKPHAIGPPLSQCSDKNEVCLLPFAISEGRKDTHTTFVLFQTLGQCSYMFKAQAEVTSLWNPHNNGDCYRSVGCFCIKNTFFMLRLLLAIRLVHQVVTWKTKKNWKQ